MRWSWFVVCVCACVRAVLLLHVSVWPWSLSIHEWMNSLRWYHSHGISIWNDCRRIYLHIIAVVSLLNEGNRRNEEEDGWIDRLAKPCRFRWFACKEEVFIKISSCCVCRINPHPPTHTHAHPMDCLSVVSCPSFQDTS